MEDGPIERAAGHGGLTARPSSLTAYFIATFAAAWALWMAAGSLAPASLGPTIRGLLFLPGVFAPGIVALCMTSRSDGPEGVRALLNRIFVWRVGMRWYVFALFSVAGAKLLAAAVYRLAQGAWPPFETLPWYVLLGATIPSTLFQAGEEIGWRGYALPRLASRLGLGRASLIVGGLWAAWHLPFFYMPGTGMTGQPFLPYLLDVVAISVAIAWLYWRTGGSLLLAMIMHAAVNNMASIVPSSVPNAADPMTVHLSLLAWLTAGSLWAMAACLLVSMRRAQPVDWQLRAVPN